MEDYKTFLSRFRSEEEKKALMGQIDIWYGMDEHQKIVDAIMGLPEVLRDTEIMGQLAVAYNNMGQYEKAIETLEGIREACEKDPMWYYRLGYAYFYLKDYGRAKELFGRSILIGIPEYLEDDVRSFLEACEAELQKDEEFQKRKAMMHPKEYKKEEITTLEKHIEKYFGEFPNVMHEILSPDIHVDICIIPPMENKPYYTLVTMGMGAYQMEIPKELRNLKLERAELVMYLPKDWKLGETDERWFWPIRWMKIVARLPVERNTWLGLGHTLSYGEAFADNTKLCGSMLIAPQDVDTEAAVCVFPDGEEVNFYQILPLYQEEMELKAKEGVSSLLDQMKGMPYVYVLDLDRRNVAKKDGEVSFGEQIAPFFWKETEDGAFLYLEGNSAYQREVFSVRSDEGFEGNGYDWADLARVFIEEERPDLRAMIQLIPTADRFCAFSLYPKALRDFALSFKAMCENNGKMSELLQKVE